MFSYKGTKCLQHSPSLEISEQCKSQFTEDLSKIERIRSSPHTNVKFQRPSSIGVLQSTAPQPEFLEKLVTLSPQGPGQTPGQLRARDALRLCAPCQGSEFSPQGPADISPCRPQSRLADGGRHTERIQLAPHKINRSLEDNKIPGDRGDSLAK